MDREWHFMDLMDGQKCEFYSMQTLLLLKEGNKVAVVGLYGLESSTKPLNISEGVNPYRANYCDFMDMTFFVCYNSLSRSFEVKCVFMQINAPFHISKLTSKFFEH